MAPEIAAQAFERGHASLMPVRHLPSPFGPQYAGFVDRLYYHALEGRLRARSRKGQIHILFNGDTMPIANAQRSVAHAQDYGGYHLTFPIPQRLRGIAKQHGLKRLPAAAILVPARTKPPAGVGYRNYFPVFNRGSCCGLFSSQSRGYDKNNVGKILLTGSSPVMGNRAPALDSSARTIEGAQISKAAAPTKTLLRVIRSSTWSF